MKRIEIHSQVTLKNMKRHHMSMENFFIENTEDNFETRATLEMKQRASIDGCLNYEGYLLMGAHNSMLVT